MKHTFGAGPGLHPRVQSIKILAWSIPVAVLACFISSIVTAATPQTYDIVSYSWPDGFQAAPLQGKDHLSYRRVDPTSWIIISLFSARPATRDHAAEFAFDWKDLNAVGGIAPPAPSSRRVGSDLKAREGGAFIPTIGYVDLIDIRASGKMIAISIHCGNEDQFHSYQPAIEEFLSTLVVNRDPTPAPAVLPVPPPSTPLSTTRRVDYVNDGFVWTGANGLEYVPPLEPIQRGAGFPKVIAGIWQNDHDQCTLQLAEDGTYASTYAGSGASGAIRIRETGRWDAVGTQLILMPEGAINDSRNFSNHRNGETTNVDCGGPRRYEVATLLLEYRRNNLMYQVNGIELNGPPAPWYYSPSGRFLIVLRRTGSPVAR